MADQYFRGHRVLTAAERAQAARRSRRPLAESMAVLDREGARIVRDGLQFWRSLRIGSDGRFTTRPR